MTALRVLVVAVDVHKTYLMSANARPHWRTARQQTRVLRQMAALELRQGLAEVHGSGWRLPTAAAPYFARARVVVEVAWPNRRRRDVANVAPTIKALIDGLVTDGHLLPDDDDAHLTGPDLRVAPDLSGRPDVTRLTFRIEERA